jgi:hypothetical protein
VQLYRYFVSRSSEFYSHNPLFCFSTSDYCCKHIFRYRISTETSGYTLVHLPTVIPGFLLHAYQLQNKACTFDVTYRPVNIIYMLILQSVVFTLLDTGLHASWPNKRGEHFVVLFFHMSPRFHLSTQPLCCNYYEACGWSALFSVVVSSLLTCVCVSINQASISRFIRLLRGWRASDVLPKILWPNSDVMPAVHGLIRPLPVSKTDCWQQYLPLVLLICLDTNLFVAICSLHDVSHVSKKGFLLINNLLQDRDSIITKCLLIPNLFQDLRSIAMRCLLIPNLF